MASFGEKERMVEADPVWGGFMVQMGTYLPELGLILGRRLLQTLQRGIRSGRFTVANEATALAVVPGAMFGAMHARLGKVLPDSLPDDLDSLVAEQLLQLLGLPREEAAEIARRPLPESSEERPPAADANTDWVPLISRSRMS